MPRSLKIILWVCLGLVAVLALCFTLLATFDWNYVRPWINQQASQAADRPVAIKGDLDVDWIRSDTAKGWRGWIPWPEITAKDVVVGNPAGPAEGKSMAEVSSLTVLVNPLALLGKTVEIADLQVEKANVLLERQADGTANWDFKKKDENDTPSDWKFDLQKISLQSVHAQVIDATSKLDMKADLDTLEATTPEGYGMGWKASGTYNEAEVSGEGSTGGILSLRQGSNPFPLRGEMKVGSTVIALEGSVTRPQALAALDVRLKLAGDTMADLLPLVGIALPDTPPYSTEGHLIGLLEGDDDRWRYEDFKGKVGESDIRGTLEYQLRKPRPLLTGEVESEQLRLKDLGPLIGVQTSDVKGKDDKKKAAKQPAGKALPVAPINTKAWGVMDADVQFKGLRILREKALPLDHIEAHVKLDNKVLTLTPLNFGVAGGNLRNTIKLDGRSDKIAAELKTAARHLKMKQLFPGAESMNASFGEVHGDAELTGRGNSIAELLGHSNGEVKALVSRGTISQFLLEAAGLNVANAVLVKIFGDEQIVLNCLAADFGVKNGLMNARAFRLETDDTIVDITGTINLNTEVMDLDIRPANKTVRIFTLRSPLYAKGTFKDPDVGVQPGPLMARAGAAVALGIIATPFAALLPLLNVGTDESAGCASLEARAQADPKAPPPGKTASGGSASDGKQSGSDSKQSDSESKKPTSEAKEKTGEGKKPSAAERENWPSEQPKP
ncbi:MAG TPA: AsmA family protein [Burkholderiaceae bacterium]|nr:AsmA family protein [Burkholderiaceae bacterium]